MKKIKRLTGSFAIFLSITFMFVLLGCGAEMCDICAQEGRGSAEEVWGEEIFICNDCQEGFESFGEGLEQFID